MKKTSRKTKRKMLFWGILTIIIATVGVALYINPAFLSSLPIYHYTYAHADAYQVGNGEVTDVDALDISWIGGNVHVEVYEGTAVQFSEQYAGTPKDDDRLHYWKDGSTLRLQFCSSRWVCGTMLEKELTVRIPASLVPSLSVNSVSADIFIVGLETTSLRADSVSGEQHLTDCQAQSATLQSTSGDIVLLRMVTTSLCVETVSGNISVTEVNGQTCSLETVSGKLTATDIAFEKTEAESVSGNGYVSFAETALPDTLEIDTVSGNFSLILPAGMGFSLEKESVSGDLISDLPLTFARANHAATYGDAAMSLSFESVSGDLQIEAK